MSKKIQLIIEVVVLVIMTGAIFALSNKDEQKSPAYSCGNYNKKILNLSQNEIILDISDNDCKRILGLSGRESLKSNEGMLFVFDEVGNHGFWMKDMNFPIDIIFIDENFVIVGIEKDVRPETYPQTFGKQYNSKFIIEMKSGASDNYKLKVGNKLNLSIK